MTLGFLQFWSFNLEFFDSSTTELHPCPVSHKLYRRQIVKSMMTGAGLQKENTSVNKWYQHCVQYNHSRDRKNEQSTNTLIIYSETVIPVGIQGCFVSARSE